jgi:hypothetical protein
MAVTLALLLIFVRETYNSELLRRKARRMRKETGEERWIAPVEKLDRTFMEALQKSIKTPFGELTPLKVIRSGAEKSVAEHATYGPFPRFVVGNASWYSLPLFWRCPVHFPRTIRLVSLAIHNSLRVQLIS